MDKKIIMQYKASFDSIVQYIESDDAKEQIEVLVCTRATKYIRLCPLGKLSGRYTSCNGFM